MTESAAIWLFDSDFVFEINSEGTMILTEECFDFQLKFRHDEMLVPL